VKNFQYLIINLMESGIHLGEKKKQYNPELGEILNGSRFDLSIINLEKTVLSLKQTIRLVNDLGFFKSNFLFVNYDLATVDVTYYYAQLLNQLFLSKKWMGGFLTNYKELRLRLRWPRINVPVLKLPKALFIINTKDYHWAFNEGISLKLPIISVLNSNNTQFKQIQYGIPGNDKTIIAINFYNRILADAYQQGLLVRYFKIIGLKLLSFYRLFKIILKFYSLVFMYFRLLLLIIITSNFYINTVFNNNNNNDLNNFIKLSLKLLLLMLNQLNRFSINYKLKNIKLFLKGKLIKLLLIKLHFITFLVINYLINLYDLKIEDDKLLNLDVIYFKIKTIKNLLNKRFYVFNSFDYHLYFGLKTNFYK
jgi:small subunit ribosomal protein S2